MQQFSDEFLPYFEIFGHLLALGNLGFYLNMQIFIGKYRVFYKDQWFIYLNTTNYKLCRAKC